MKKFCLVFILLLLSGSVFGQAVVKTQFKLVPDSILQNKIQSYNTILLTNGTDSVWLTKDTANNWSQAWDSVYMWVTDSNFRLAYLDSTGATTGQVVKFNGTYWAPGTDNSGGAGLWEVAGDSLRPIDTATLYVRIPRELIVDSISSRTDSLNLWFTRTQGWAGVGDFRCLAISSADTPIDTLLISPYFIYPKGGYFSPGFAVTAYSYYFNELIIPGADTTMEDYGYISCLQTPCTLFVTPMLDFKYGAEYVRFNTDAAGKLCDSIGGFGYGLFRPGGDFIIFVDTSIIAELSDLWDWSDSSSHGPDSVLYADTSNHAYHADSAEVAAYAYDAPSIWDEGDSVIVYFIGDSALVIETADDTTYIRTDNLAMILGDGEVVYAYGRLGWRLADGSVMWLPRSVGAEGNILKWQAGDTLGWGPDQSGGTITDTALYLMSGSGLKEVVKWSGNSVLFNDEDAGTQRVTITGDSLVVDADSIITVLIVVGSDKVGNLDGAGLTISGDSINVGAGTGITVNDDNVAHTPHTGEVTGATDLTIATNVVDSTNVGPGDLAWNDLDQTNLDTAHWNLAYSWDDHSTQGYEQFDDSGSFMELPKCVINTQLYIGHVSDTAESDSLAATHGWVTSLGYASGDITSVTAGNGLVGGGTTGDVTLNVNPGTGIDTSGDAVVATLGTNIEDGEVDNNITITGLHPDSQYWNDAYDSMQAWDNRGYPDASTTQQGVAQFSSDDFSVITGEVFIADGAIEDIEVDDNITIDATGSVDTGAIGNRGEMIADHVGGMFTDGTYDGITFTYQDGDNTMDATVENLDSLNVTNLGLQLGDIAASGAATGQVPKWNGTKWAPASDDAGGGTSDVADTLADPNCDADTGGYVTYGSHANLDSVLFGARKGASFEPLIFRHPWDSGYWDLASTGILRTDSLRLTDAFLFSPENILEVAKSGKAYDSIPDALNAASPGDLVVVYPGVYSSTDWIILRDSVDLYLCAGVTVQNTDSLGVEYDSTYVFWDSAQPVRASIYGNGNIKATRSYGYGYSYAIMVENEDTYLRIECDTIYGHASALKVDSGKVDLHCDRIWAGTYYTIELEHSGQLRLWGNVYQDAYDGNCAYCIWFEASSGTACTATVYGNLHSKTQAAAGGRGTLYLHGDAIGSECSYLVNMANGYAHFYGSRIEQTGSVTQPEGLPSWEGPRCLAGYFYQCRFEMVNDGADVIDAGTAYLYDCTGDNGIDPAVTWYGTYTRDDVGTIYSAGYGIFVDSAQIDTLTANKVKVASWFLLDDDSISNFAGDNLTIDASGNLNAATGSGDIEGVTAGNGLIGGGESGTVTLHVNPGTGIDTTGDDVDVDLSVFDTDDLSQGSSNLYDQALPDSGNWSDAWDSVQLWGDRGYHEATATEKGIMRPGNGLGVASGIVAIDNQGVDSGMVDFGTGPNQVDVNDFKSLGTLDMLYTDANGNVENFNLGSADQLLKAQGGTSPPTWFTPTYYIPTDADSVTELGPVISLANEVTGNLPWANIDTTGGIISIARNADSLGEVIDTNYLRSDANDTSHANLYVDTLETKGDIYIGRGEGDSYKRIWWGSSGLQGDSTAWLGYSVPSGYFYFSDSLKAAAGLIIGNNMYISQAGGPGDIRFNYNGGAVDYDGYLWWNHGDDIDSVQFGWDATNVWLETNQQLCMNGNRVSDLPSCAADSDAVPLYELGDSLQEYIRESGSILEDVTIWQLDIAGDLNVYGLINQLNWKTDLNLAEIRTTNPDDIIDLETVFTGDSAGSDQEDSSRVVHPSILYFPDGFRGDSSARYMLGYTPLIAAATQDMENPHLMVSQYPDSGFHKLYWGGDSLVLPLCSASQFGVDYLSDFHLTTDYDAEVWGAWRSKKTGLNDSVIIFVGRLDSAATATDTALSMCHDTTRILKIQLLANDDYLSPCIVKTAGRGFKLMLVRRKLNIATHTWDSSWIYTYHAEDSLNQTFTFDTAFLASVSTGADTTILWHFDALALASDFVLGMAYECEKDSTGGGDGWCHWMYSTDACATWTSLPDTMLYETNEAGRPDSTHAYKWCVIPKVTERGIEFDAWFSMKGTDAGGRNNVWSIGHTTMWHKLPLETKQATLYAPDGLNDEMPFFFVDSSWAPYGVVVEELSITLPANAAYTMTFEEWAGNPPANQNTVEAVATGGDAYQLVSGGDIDDGILDKGDYLFWDIPTTDVDWIQTTAVIRIRQGPYERR